MKVDKYKAEQLLAFYETMFKMRRFEEETFEFYKKGMMAGLAHLYLGEEAVATGVCAALKDEDYIASTHRGHGHLVARYRRRRYSYRNGSSLFGKIQRNRPGSDLVHG